MGPFQVLEFFDRLSLEEVNRLLQNKGVTINGILEMFQEKAPKHFQKEEHVAKVVHNWSEAMAGRPVDKDFLDTCLFERGPGLWPLVTETMASALLYHTWDSEYPLALDERLGLSKARCNLAAWYLLDCHGVKWDEEGVFDSKKVMQAQIRERRG